MPWQLVGLLLGAGVLGAGVGAAVGEVGDSDGGSVGGDCDGVRVGSPEVVVSIARARENLRPDMVCELRR